MTAGLEMVWRSRDLPHVEAISVVIRHLTRSGPRRHALRRILAAKLVELPDVAWRSWPNVKRPRVASTDRLALDEAQDLLTLIVFAQARGEQTKLTASGTEATHG